MTILEDLSQKQGFENPSLTSYEAMDGPDIFFVDAIK